MSSSYTTERCSVVETHSTPVTEELAQNQDEIVQSNNEDEQSLTIVTILGGSSNSFSYCDQCAEKEHATHYCTDCDENLCELHATAHAKSRKTTSHRLQLIRNDIKIPTEEPAHGNNNICGVFCSVHPSEKLSLVCNTCDTAIICRDCALISHKSHDFVFITEVVEDKKQQLLLLAEHTDKYITLLEQDIEAIRVRKKEVQDKATSCSHILSSACQQIVNALEKKVECLEKELNGILSRKLSVLQNDEEALSSLLVNLRLHDGDHMKTWNDVKIIEMSKTATETIGKLSKEFSKPIALDPDSFEVFVDNQDILKYIAQWGRISDKAISLERCRAYGRGIGRAYVNVEVGFNVDLIDANGAPYSGAGQLQVHIDTLEQENIVDVHIARVDGSLSSYIVTYVPISEGTYVVHVTVDGHDIKNSPFQVKVTKDALKFDLSCKFGSRGSEKGQFNHPHFMATKNNLDKQDIYVSDSSNKRIQIFDFKGTWKQNFEVVAVKEGQFETPRGITFDSKGFLAVCDEEKHRIVVYDRNLRFSRSFGTLGKENGKFHCPRAIRTDKKDNFYVVDSGNCRIQVFRNDGTFIHSFGREGSNQGEFTYPYDIVVSQNGKVFVSDRDAHCIQVFNSRYQFVQKIGSEGNKLGELSFPRGIALIESSPQDPFDYSYLIVCDEDNLRLQVFNADDGRPVQCVTTEGYPYGINVTRESRVIISECSRDNQHQLKVFDIEF